jgi:hypothetical protein
MAGKAALACLIKTLKAKASRFSLGRKYKTSQKKLARINGLAYLSGLPKSYED